MPKSTPPRTARNVALGLLSRREHSEHELRQKLKLREFLPEEIDPAIVRLIADSLLSDQRFTESYVRHRMSAGVGPLKIRFELRKRGVEDELSDDYLDLHDARWDELMLQQRMRKFGAEIPADFSKRMKQARFLQNRGFSPESVMRLFR